MGRKVGPEEIEYKSVIHKVTGERMIIKTPFSDCDCFDELCNNCFFFNFDRYMREHHRELCNQKPFSKTWSAFLKEL